jgi:Ni/Fe-hydrogenase subunit HybB-like protein
MSEDDRRITEAFLARMGISGHVYLAGLLVTVLMMLIGAVSWGLQLWYGLGVAGFQPPMMWATYIASFVWWIGIAHSGTLLSAILYLFQAPYRASFARTAEAMTLIAIVTSAAYPIIHLGRAWRFYWLVPYPNERHLWVTFRSPLIFDVFAVLTYFIVSVLFFWLGLIPDLAIVRDRARHWRKTVYGLLSLGWEGRGRQWKQYLMAYSLLAALATPLVISVHSIVSWDFSLAITPGWHSSFFPPYFVAGAMFSGLAMVLTLVIPMRAGLGLQEYITVEHLEQIARLILFMSLVISFCYGIEYFMVWYNGEDVEKLNLLFRATGPFAPLFWTMTVCNSLVPLALFSRRVRRNLVALFAISILVNIGMWLERFVIVAGSLGRGYLPYAWAPSGYRIMAVEWGIFIGSMGWFLFWFLLFVRYLPVLPIAEFKRDELKKQREKQALHAPLRPEEAQAVA